LDNVEKLENLLEKVVDKLSLATNVKFLITTRNSNLIEGLDSIKIDMFNENEAKEFIEQNLIKKVLNLEQWKKLNALITFENEVLPLKLDLTISYINKELIKSNEFDEILDEVKQRSTQSDKLVEVEDYLFEDLFKDDKYKNFLVYCSYFKPDCISLKFLNKLFDSSQNIEIFEKLSEQSFIAVNYDDSTFSMHRLIQAKIKNYRKAHASNFESEKHILDRIIQVLAANVDEPNNLTRLDDLVKNRERDVQFTQIEEVLNFSFENVELNQTERVALMKKLAMYYKYCQINYKKECELRTMVLERIKIIHGEENHPQIADSLYSLGVSYTHLGDYRKAHELNEKAYEMRKVLFGNEAHPDIAYSLYSLGVSYSSFGSQC
jgi:tetratricopeptide (TPR) repeat protein